MKEPAMAATFVIGSEIELFRAKNLAIFAG
jgi:hypothetical protein